ncbi:MAG: single-stranded-DNA-specific exonuclease RecJ, partial [Candidatus Eisenbacteria bacterium]
MSEKPRWILPSEGPPPDWEVVQKDWGIPSPVLATLWNRGLRTAPEVERFLKPRLENLHDPFLLTDCDRAVARVRRALEHGEPILVFGDYDVDGITAASLWTRVLRHLGATVSPMVPNRMEDGYGLSLRAVERAEASGASLLIANDCGTTAHEAIAFANERKVDVVVCDHHMPEASLPAAHALVNPRRSDDSYPFPDMAAVGVAFKVLQGLVGRHYGPEEQKYLFGQLDLVTLGTVADVVPLVDENRVFVHFGMRVLRVRRRPAFQALVEQARLSERFLEASHLAFSLVPRINAAGRLGSPETALGLLLEDELDAARQLAGRLEEDNTARKGLNERVQSDAFQWLADSPPGDGDAIVLGSADWHPGVLGIAASRLAAHYRVPVFLVSLTGEIARGSARTPGPVSLLRLLEGAAEHLAGFGGHRQAAGFS